MPAYKSVNPNALAWIVGNDTGVSSETIWAVMLDVEPKYGWDNVPDDQYAFGRCVRLLDLVPEWRCRMPEMAKKQPQWRRFVQEWKALEEWYKELTEAGVLYDNAFNVRIKTLAEPVER